MYNIVHRIMQFKMNNDSDTACMAEIINNPLCTVIKKQFITLESKEFSSQGKLSSTSQEVVCVVEWNEKELAI